MKVRILLSILFLFLAFNASGQSAAELSELWQREHISNILPSNVRHKDLKAYVERLSMMGIDTLRVGRSELKKDIFQLHFGEGPIKVFLWSQMHGDEPTATSALIDMFAVLRRNRNKQWVKEIESKLTIHAVPMLNPDGADVYVRRNANGIDINRDAVERKSLEAQLMKKLHDKWKPEIGFNLHDQNSLTTVGETNKQAAISLLVVYGDEAKTTNEGHERNKRLTSAMIAALQPYIPGHIARYDDGFAPAAFGDNLSAWGTPVILIETGGLAGQSEMFLVKMNFIAYLTALNALANGSEKAFSPANYDQLSNNSTGRIFDVIFRNATLIDRTSPSAVANSDIGVNLERRREEYSSPAVIRQIDGITGASGIEEFDAGEFHMTGRFQPLMANGFAEILFYRKSRQIDWSVADVEKQFPPDAIYSLGKWKKGDGIVPKKVR